MHDGLDLEMVRNFGTALLIGALVGIEREKRKMIAGLAGLTDVDAITLSMAEYAKTGDPLVASNAIVLATLANTAVKTGIVTSLGAAALSRPVLIAAGAIVAAGLAAIALF
jgi:uncharacterized membrane protein (DUF4010 family)